MGHPFAAFALAFLSPALALPLSAQSWSVAGVAETPGTAHVTVASSSPPTTASTTIAAGTPVTIAQPMTVYATVPWASGSGHGTVELVPLADPVPTAPVGMHIHAGAYASISGSLPPPPPSFYASADADAAWLVHVTAPPGTAGRVLVHSSRSFSEMSVGSGSIRIDVGADGSYEFTNQGSVGMSGLTWDAEQPFVVPVGGLDIRVVAACGVTAPYLGFSNFASASLHSWLYVLPDQAVVAPHVHPPNALLGLTVTHDLQDFVLLQMQGATPGIFVFGTQAMSVPVPGYPTLTQLVSIDAVAIAPSLLLPMPALPHGSQLFVQGLGVAVNGVLGCSNSYRAYWP